MVARRSLERARRMLSSPRRQANTLAEHKAILVAMMTRNAEEAATAMKNHLDEVLAEIVTFMEIEPSVFETQ